MSSGQGSLTNKLGGQRERYRGSKAALNMFMRSFAARPTSAFHPLVVMAPGWIRTELGGADAPLTIEETIPRLVNVLLDKQRRPPVVIDPRSPRHVPLCPAAFAELIRLFCSKFMKFVNGGEEISLNVNFSV